MCWKAREHLLQCPPSGDKKVGIELIFNRFFYFTVFFVAFVLWHFADVICITDRYPVAKRRGEMKDLRSLSIKLKLLFFGYKLNWTEISLILPALWRSYKCNFFLVFSRIRKFMFFSIHFFFFGARRSSCWKSGFLCRTLLLINHNFYQFTRRKISTKPFVVVLFFSPFRNKIKGKLLVCAAQEKRESLVAYSSWLTNRWLNHNRAWRNFSDDSAAH